MADHIETRKLAAVMFTDIEGSSSMFQHNESKAIDVIEDLRKHLRDVTGIHKGQIIQFYGDGSLVTFDSVIDAVRSAIQIQQNSISQKIPVRIGIHMGDLIIKDGNIFGDVVNMASRIQALGISGSILISRKVADELSNHPEITITGLGYYDLKNIHTRQELFAITGHGLTVPQKQIKVEKKNPVPKSFMVVGMLLLLAGIYLVKPHFAKQNPVFPRDEKIAVPPFENFTSDPGLSTISQMAAHWITTELIESVDANVVSYQSSLFNTNITDASVEIKPSFARQTGAVNIIKGAFNYYGHHRDSLVFWANILNIRTGQLLPIKLEKAYCKADEPLKGIQILSNEIKGFWKSKNENVLSPPNYQAYIAYLQARNNWDLPSDSIAESFLRKSILLDPDFIDAYFLLLDLFYNRRNPLEAADTLKSMRSRFTDLTPRQENYLLYHEEDVKGHRVAAYKHFLTEYQTDPKDLFVNTSGMVMALEYLNDPSTVLKFDAQIDDDSLDFYTCNYCRERAILLLQAHALLGNTEKAETLVKRLKPLVSQRDDYMRLVEWYVSRGDSTSADALLLQAGEVELDKDYRYLYFVAGRQAALQGKLSLQNYYADKTIRLYSGKPSRSLARSYYLKNDLPAAEKIYNTLLKEKGADERIYGELGMIYAKRGDKERAYAIIEKLDQLKKAFDYGEISYFQGRIMALMDEKEQALTYLNKALDEGLLFVNSVSFAGDPDLMVLHDDEGYKKLLHRNRQP